MDLHTGVVRVIRHWTGHGQEETVHSMRLARGTAMTIYREQPELPGGDGALGAQEGAASLYQSAYQDLNRGQNDASDGHFECAVIAGDNMPSGRAIPGNWQGAADQISQTLAEVLNDRMPRTVPTGAIEDPRLQAALVEIGVWLRNVGIGGGGRPLNGAQATTNRNDFLWVVNRALHALNPPVHIEYNNTQPGGANYQELVVLPHNQPRPATPIVVAMRWNEQDRPATASLWLYADHWNRYRRAAVAMADYMRGVNFGPAGTAIPPGSLTGMLNHFRTNVLNQYGDRGPATMPEPPSLTTEQLQYFAYQLNRSLNRASYSVVYHAGTNQLRIMHNGTTVVGRISCESPRP